MNEKHDLQQVFDQHLSSLRFQVESRQTVIERALGERASVLKKKMSVALVFAIVLVLGAMTAFAAIAVMRSGNANKINLAREALYEKYGLTAQTLGLFLYDAKEENGEYILTWTGSTFHPSLTGVYTTVVKDGKAEARWSHDDVEKSVYDSGDLSASVWGYKQLETAFENRATASEYSQALYRQGEANGEQDAPEVEPEPLKEGETFWKDGEIIHAAEPGADDLTRDQAYEIAVQALSEDFGEFGVDQTSIAASVITDESFHIRDNGQKLWIFWFFMRQDGVEYECGVTLDGATGEVLSTDALTGGNG